MQRRVEQANRHGQTIHDAENFDKIAPLHGQQLGERGLARFAGFGHNHFAHGGDAVGLEKHMLRAAEANTFSAEIARSLGVMRCFCIGADFKRSNCIRPGNDGRKIARKTWFNGGYFTEHDFAG